MHRWTRRAVAVVVAALIFGVGGVRAELFSKAYTFKPGTLLEVGSEMPGGLRLDSVEFVLPADGGNRGLFGGPKVKVSISNLGSSAAKVGVSIAVTDGEGRLVGVASGGTKLFPLRAGRQIVYSLGVDGVRTDLAAGTVFRISVEPMP